MLGLCLYVNYGSFLHCADLTDFLQQGKLLYCVCNSRTFKVYDLTGKLRDMSNDEDVRHAAQLLDWLIIRHLEIDMFCYLQKSVNALEDLSISDLYDVIASLVELLVLLSGYWEHAVKRSPV